MTLNIILASPTAVYLSADFRISDQLGTAAPIPRPDNFDVQKLIPVVRARWGGLLAYTGTWRVPSAVADVGAWMAEHADNPPLKSTLRDLLNRLLEAESWLSAPASAPPEIAFSFVGFEGRRPFVHLISNVLDDRYRRTPVGKKLIVSSFRPTLPCVRNPWGLTNEEKSALVEALGKEPAKFQNVHRLLAQTNASVSRRSNTVSEPCVTGCVVASGDGSILPSGIPPGKYLPGFIEKGFIRNGWTGFKLKCADKGNSLPPRWKQSATKFDTQNLSSLELLEIENILEPIGGGERSPGRHAWWRIAGENEPNPLRVTVTYNKRR
jgi:hypothetical protein